MYELSGMIGPLGASLTVMVRAPDGEPLHLPAFLDTGTTNTMASQYVLTGLKARQLDWMILGSATSGPRGQRCPRHLVELGIYNAASDVRRYLLPVAAVDLRGCGHDVVIGWDILSKCVLICNGPEGTFRLQY